MWQNPKFEDGLTEAFVAALRQVPGARADVAAREFAAGGHGKIDILVDTEIGGKPMLLLVEVRQEAFPRDVREAVWQLETYAKKLTETEKRHIQPFLIAEAISPGAREILRERDVGYFDKSGSLYVPAPGAFVFVDRPQPKRKRRATGAVFYGRKSQVLMTVFERRKEWLSVKEVSDASGVSPPTVSQTLSDLERREWMESQGSGPAKVRRLSDARAVVDAWVRYVSEQKPPKIRRYYVPASGQERLVRYVAEAYDVHAVKYAITGEAAAQIYSPYLTNVSQVICRVQSGASLELALEMMDARPAQEGWNVGLYEVKASEGFCSIQELDRVNLAHPLQVYLDLLALGTGRSKDMAEHFRHEKLGL